MAEWIDRMFSSNRAEPGVEFDLLMNGLIDNIEPVTTIIRDRFRIQVFQCEEPCEDCGRHLHWLSFDFQIANKWKSMIALDERNLRHVVSALRELIGFLNDGEQNESVPYPTTDGFEIV